MSWELVTALPPGEASRTLLARMGTRFAVLRQLETEPEKTARTLPPAVLALREVAVVAAKRYAVYDVVVGVSLREVCETQEPHAPVGLAVRAVTQAARALASITPAKPHGGLSDAALLVGFDGDIRVVDFGAPRRNRFQVGGSPSLANDVFALAAVLHSALTGFAGNYGDAVADGLTLPPPSQLNAKVPAAIDGVVLRALARTAESRQAGPAQLADELEAAFGPSFGQAETARTLHAVLSHRRTHLTDMLGGGSVSSSTAPSLGVARPPEYQAPDDEPDEKTTVHLVPWVTGASNEPLPPVKKPAVADGPPPRIPLDTAPAWPPLEAGVEPTGPKEAELGAEPDEATAPRTAMPDPPVQRREVSTRADAPRAMEPKPSAPRPPPPELSRPSAPTPRAPAPAPSRPAATRAPVPAPRAELLLADDPVPPTAPRAKPMSVSQAETEDRLPPVKARNTTAEERERARGQEQVVTPPLGVPAAVAAASVEMPSIDVVVESGEGSTGEREAPSVETTGERPAPSAESEVGEPESDEVEAALRPKRGRLVLAGLLVLAALGAGALAIFAPERLAALRGAPPPTAPTEPLEELDAGPLAEEPPDAAAEPEAAVSPAVDGGDADEVEEEEVDAGTPKDSKDPKKLSKKPPKRKKRR